MADFSSLKFELDGWTLASDERFLNQMKIYFGEVISRIGQVDRLADTIDYNSTLVHSVINSSFNTLSNLSNSCFLENAMEEPSAEIGMKKSSIQGTPKPTGNFEANLIGNFAKAVKLGMDGLEILKSLEEDENDKGSVASSMGNKFERLPAIVGSKIFKDEDFLGIIEKLEEPPMNFDFNSSMMKDGQAGPVGMAQSTNSSQSQQQINPGNSNLSVPNLNLNQPQNNSSANLQPPPLLNNLQQQQQQPVNVQPSNNLPPPKLNLPGPGGSGNLPPPSLGSLLAQKEANDKTEKDNRPNTSAQDHHEHNQPQQQQQTRPTGAPQLSIADALKLKFSDQNKGAGVDQRPVTFSAEDFNQIKNDPFFSQQKPQEQNANRINNIASNPIYGLKQAKNLNSMFDDDENQDDDLGNDLFKASTKKKNKFQDLLSGNPISDTGSSKVDTPLTNPKRQEQPIMTKEQPKITTTKEPPPKKNALFTDTETDNDTANIKTDNKKLKNLFADTEDEEDVLKRGRQLTNLYKKDVQPEEPKKVSKLFVDDDDSSSKKNWNPSAGSASEKKIENNINQPDMFSKEESKGMNDSQTSSSRPSVNKVSGRISNPSAKPYLRPSIQGEGGSTTPRGMQEQSTNNETNAELKPTNNQTEEHYTEMLINKAPIATRKAKKLDFDDSDNESNKWSDNDTAAKNQKPNPQPIKLEEKTQPQPVITLNDQKTETSPRNFKFENAQTDYFGKNELLGGQMTSSVTTTKVETKQVETKQVETKKVETKQPEPALPKENPLDLLKNLNQPVETKPKAQPKKEDGSFGKDTFGGPADANNPLALLTGLKTMDKQHKKEKKISLFNDEDDDNEVFKKPPRKKTGNLWGDEPAKQKKAPPKKTKLFDDSDEDNVGSFFKKSPAEVQKPTLSEPKKEIGTKPKKPLWDDSD